MVDAVPENEVFGKVVGEPQLGDVFIGRVGDGEEETGLAVSTPGAEALRSFAASSMEVTSNEGGAFSLSLVG